MWGRIAIPGRRPGPGSPVALAAGLLSGAWAGVLVSVPVPGWVPLAAGAGSAALAAAAPPAARGLAAFAASAAAGFGRSLQAGRHILDVRAGLAGPTTEWLTVDLVSVAPRPGRSLLAGRFENAAGFQGRLRFSWYHPRQGRNMETGITRRPRAGERWRLRISHRTPRGRLNPGGWDYEAYLFRHGIHRTGYVRNDPGNRRLAPAAGLAAWRNHLSEAMAESAGSPFAAAVLPALATGHRGALAEEDWDLLAATGTAHLVAISGLHVGLLAGITFLAAHGLLRRVPVGLPVNRDDAARLLALAMAALYAGLSGFSVPARRALLMLGVWTGAGFFRRRPWGVHVLALAAMVVLAADPLAVLDPGFWLSFSAVAVLLLAAEGRKAATSLFRVQPLLWLGLLIPTAAAFGRVSLIAPFANLLAVPVFSLIVVPVTLAGVAVAPVSPGLAGGMWRGAGGAVDLVFGVLTRIADRVPADIEMAGPGGIALALGVLAAIAFVVPGPRAGKAACLAVLLLVLSARPVPPAPGAFRITVLDVGQGTAVIVATRSRVLAYDAGPRWPGGDAGRQSVGPAVRASGAGRLDALVVSHTDIDHAGGAASLLRDFRPRELRGAVADAAAVACRRGQGWTWDGVQFVVLHPRSERAQASDNDRSCVLWVGTAETGVLLPGDIGEGVEAALARDIAGLPVDVVIAPHHGSSTSSSDALVSAAAPRWAVFTTHPGNRWGFPDPRVAARWRAAGARTAVTGREGALTFDFPASGPGVLAVVERRRRCRYWRDCGSLAARR